MTLSGTGKRLGVLPPPPRSLAAFPEAFARIHRHIARLPKAFLPLLQRRAAYWEAFLPSLQGSAEFLEADPRTATAPRGSGRCASRLSSAPRSLWGRTPALPACCDAPGGGLQLLPCTRMPREARLQSHRDRPLGRKNRLPQHCGHLQKHRSHLQELAAHLQVVRTALFLCAAHGSSPTLPHSGLCGPLHHETSFLGLQ